MNPEPEKSRKSVEDDQKTHDQLSEKTKELLLLEDESEKSTGRQKGALDKVIRDKVL